MKISYYRLILSHKLYFILATVVQLIYYSTPFITAFLIKDLYDTLVGKSSLDLNPYVKVGLILSTFLLRAGLDTVSAFFQSHFGLRLQRDLRLNMLQESFSKKYSLTKSSGELVSRLRGDVDEISWFVNLHSTLLAFSIFAIAAFAVMVSISQKLTFFIVIPFVLGSFTVKQIQRKLIRYRVSQRQISGQVTEFLGDVGRNYEKIPASYLPNTLTKFVSLNRARKHSAVKEAAVTTLIKLISNSLLGLSLGILILLASNDIQSGTFSIGDLSYFLYMLKWFNRFASILNEYLAWKVRAQVSIDRLHSFSNSIDELVDFKYDPNAPLYISPIQINPSKLTPEIVLNPDENLIVSGANSTGKTRFVKGIIGLIPQKGTFRSYTKKIAYVSQEPSLLKATIAENLLLDPTDMVPSHLAEKITKTLKSVCIFDEVMSFEKGLFTDVGSSATKISGGQRQRLALARALMTDPDILIIDGGLSQLDKKTQRKILTNLSVLSTVSKLQIILTSNSHDVQLKSSYLLNLDKTPPSLQKLSVSIPLPHPTNATQ